MPVSKATQGLLLLFRLAKFQLTDKLLGSAADSRFGFRERNKFQRVRFRGEPSLDHAVIIRCGGFLVCIEDVPTIIAVLFYD